MGRPRIREGPRQAHRSPARGDHGSDGTKPCGNGRGTRLQRASSTDSGKASTSRRSRSTSRTEKSVEPIETERRWPSGDQTGRLQLPAPVSKVCEPSGGARGNLGPCALLHVEDAQARGDDVGEPAAIRRPREPLAFVAPGSRLPAVQIDEDATGVATDVAAAGLLVAARALDEQRALVGRQRDPPRPVHRQLAHELAVEAALDQRPGGVQDEEALAQRRDVPRDDFARHRRDADRQHLAGAFVESDQRVATGAHGTAPRGRDLVVRFLLQELEQQAGHGLFDHAARAPDGTRVHALVAFPVRAMQLERRDRTHGTRVQLDARELALDLQPHEELAAVERPGRRRPVSHRAVVQAARRSFAGVERPPATVVVEDQGRVVPHRVAHGPGARQRDQQAGALDDGVGVSRRRDLSERGQRAAGDDGNGDQKPGHAGLRAGRWMSMRRHPRRRPEFCRPAPPAQAFALALPLRLTTGAGTGTPATGQSLRITRYSMMPSSDDVKM